MIENFFCWSLKHVHAFIFYTPLLFLPPSPSSRSHPPLSPSSPCPLHLLLHLLVLSTSSFISSFIPSSSTIFLKVSPFILLQNFKISCCTIFIHIISIRIPLYITLKILLSINRINLIFFWNRVSKHYVTVLIKHTQ